MNERKQIYKCNVCGNIVEMLHAGKGELICCGQPMELKKELSGDEGTEKHTPVIEKTDKGILVKIGSVPHPMEPEHWIEWIELNADCRSYKKFLEPSDEPQALFEIEGQDLSARAYCNVHYLWRNE